MFCIQGNRYEDVGTRQKQRRHSQIKDDVETILGPPLAAIGLYVKSLKLSTEEQDPVIVVDEENIDMEHHHIATLTYYILRHGVSMEFYHEMSMLFKDLPRSYKVQQV